HVYTLSLSLPPTHTHTHTHSPVRVSTHTHTHTHTQPYAHHTPHTHTLHGQDLYSVYRCRNTLLFHMVTSYVSETHTHAQAISLFFPQRPESNYISLSHRRCTGFIG